MPIRPSRVHHSGPAYGWSKTVAPRNDALAQGDFYSARPKCAHTSLDVQPAGVAAGTVLGVGLAEIAQSFEQL